MFNTHDFADDMVILIDSHPQHVWLARAVEKRLREELVKLQSGDKRREEQNRRFGKRREVSLSWALANIVAFWVIA